MPTLRLQRFMAESGVASRRKAEELIAQGRVEVNGRVAVLGQTVDPERDRVVVDGEGIRRARTHLYLLMNKPKCVICTADDPQGRPTAFSLLPPLPGRVHAVGRLDFNSEGLLLFTNDGDLTRVLTRPSGGVERVYEVKIQGEVPVWAVGKLTRGVVLQDGPARAARCERLRETRSNIWLSLTLTEGRYREVRRMCQAVGLNVLKLRRVRFGPIRLGRLAPGRSRPLTATEVEALRTCTESRSGGSRPPPGPCTRRSPGPRSRTGGRGSPRSPGGRGSYPRGGA